MQNAYHFVDPNKDHSETGNEPGASSDKPNSDSSKEIVPEE